MQYDVGTHIDLTYLNRKPVTVQAAPKSSSLYEVGTEILFRLQGKGLTAARRIPVVFA